MDFLSAERPRVFGHRGASGLAPENTLPSFAIAAALGVPYLELDVHGTRDGAIAVMHDDDLDRTTDGNGPIREVAWADVERLDAGFRFEPQKGVFPYRGQGVCVPLLERVVREFADLRFNIEIKQSQPDIVGEVVAILRRCGVAQRTLLAAADDDIMRHIRAAVGSDIVTGSSIGDVSSFFHHLEAGTLDDYDPPGVALQIPTHAGARELVTAASVAAAHAKQLEVHVWTVNEPAEIERLLDLGVDGIMSDLPGLVLQALRRRTVQ